MARLVDPVGKLVGPDSIAAIEYSVFQINETGIGENYGDPICNSEPLRVADVVLPQLYRELQGDADVSGFNFRHCFVFPNCTGRWTNGSRFEVRYAFTQMTGEETTVRFRIGATRNDRYRTDPLYP